MPGHPPNLAVGIGDVRAAAGRLGHRVHRTPVLSLDRLGLLVKCESLQGIGAFKIRGATNAILVLRPAGVVTSSSGNHGMAVAAAAAAARIGAVVVMPDNATRYKREAVARLGAEVLTSPPETEARNAACAARPGPHPPLRPWTPKCGWTTFRARTARSSTCSPRIGQACCMPSPMPCTGQAPPSKSLESPRKGTALPMPSTCVTSPAGLERPAAKLWTHRGGRPS